MKSKKLIVLVMALTFVLLTVSTVSAKSERIEFTFTEACDFNFDDMERLIVNGQGNYLFKNWTVVCSEESDNIQMKGIAYFEWNVNGVGSHEYPFFVGKGRIETVEGGVWNLNCLYPLPSDDLQCVGKGEGLYEGQQIFYTFYLSQFGSGYIVDHSE